MCITERTCAFASVRVRIVCKTPMTFFGDETSKCSQAAYLLDDDMLDVQNRQMFLDDDCEKDDGAHVSVQQGHERYVPNEHIAVNAHTTDRQRQIAATQKKARRDRKRMAKLRSSDVREQMYRFVAFFVVSVLILGIVLLLAYLFASEPGSVGIGIGTGAVDSNSRLAPLRGRGPLRGPCCVITSAGSGGQRPQTALCVDNVSRLACGERGTLRLPRDEAQRRCTPDSCIHLTSATPP